MNAKVGGYFNNLRAANQAFVMERRDHAGGDGQTLNLRVIGGRYHYTAAGQLAQHEDTSTVQLSGNLFSGHWGDDGEWMLGIVGGYSDNQGDSRSNMTGTRADNQNRGYAVGLTSSWYQHGNQKQGPGWIAGCNMRGLTMMFPNKTMEWIITTRRGLSPRWKPVISGYRGVVW